MTADWQVAAQRSAALRRRARRALTPWAVGVAAFASSAGALAWVAHAPAGAGSSAAQSASRARALRADQALSAQLANQTQAEQRLLAAMGGSQVAAIPALPPPTHATTGASGVP